MTLNSVTAVTLHYYAESQLHQSGWK